MKKLISILFFGLLLTSYVSAVTIESAVYDFKIDKDKLEGFSLLVVRAEDELDEITLFSDTKVNLITEGLNYEEDNSKIKIKNLKLRGGEEKKIILKIESELSGENINFPVFRFPYQVEKTLIGVEESRNKFVWKIDFPAYAVGDNDVVLMQEDVTDDEIKELDKLMLELRASLPGYRVYLDGIEPNGEIVVSGWSGKSYQFYLPNILPVVGICIVLFLVLYFIFRMPTFSVEKKQEREEKKEFNWLKIKSTCEENLGKLSGDEYKVYKEIFDSEGEILQRELPERLGFYKAKVTRILDKLERKGLVERKSYGVTNKVVLK